MTKPSEHHADRCPAEECEGVSVQALPVFGETSASVQPADRALDDPSLGQHSEAFGGVAALDDLDVHLPHGLEQALFELRALIASIGIEFQQKREQAEQAGHHQHAAIAVLDVGGVHDSVQQQSLCIDEEMALLAFDLFTSVEAGGINPCPSFSALLTL